jgi:hypothetical protein
MPFGASKDSKKPLFLFLFSIGYFFFVVVVCLIASWFPPLHDTPPIAMIDLLQVVGCLEGEILTFSLC